MKKDYNRDVMSDMPMEASFVAPAKTTSSTKTATKPKINAIGTQKRTTKTSTASKSSSGKTSTSKSTTKTATAKSTKATETKSKTAASKSVETKTSKTKKEQPVEETFESKKLRTKLVNADSDITDLEKLNESNIKSYRFKSKRNKVIIVVLSFLLILSILAVTILLTISKLKSNCYLYAYGNVDAVFVVNGQEMKKFRTPSNLQGNRILEVDIDVQINTYAQYNIRFIPMCYQKGMLLENTLIYEHNTDLFKYGGDGYYYSIAPIQGGQTIDLCGGIILDYDYQDTLNVDNFLLEFCVYFEKV